MTKFPQFRKSHNEKSYYNLMDESKFLELQIIGSKYIIHQIEVRILPERNLFNDLLENKNDHWICIKKKEYERIFDYCKLNLSQIHQ